MHLQLLMYTLFIIYPSITLTAEKDPSFAPEEIVFPEVLETIALDDSFFKSSFINPEEEDVLPLFYGKMPSIPHVPLVENTHTNQDTVETPIKGKRNFEEFCYICLGNIIKDENTKVSLATITNYYFNDRKFLVDHCINFNHTQKNSISNTMFSCAMCKTCNEFSTLQDHLINHHTLGIGDDNSKQVYKLRSIKKKKIPHKKNNSCSYCLEKLSELVKELNYASDIHSTCYFINNTELEKHLTHCKNKPLKNTAP